jgi:DNA-binding NarL/FixJ family response regulator
MDVIRVLLVDDHPVLRRGLRSLLSCYEDIEVIGEAADGASAVQLAAELSPDVILLDVELPGPGGLEIARQLRSAASMARIIVLSAYDNDEYVLGSLRLGAYAYLLKRTSDETVVDAVRQVYQGTRLLSPSLVGKVLREFQALAECHARHEVNISEPELQVLALLAKGATTAEISEKMYWSERTAKRKVQEILEKLGAANRAQAVAQAIGRGLIQP